MCGAARRFVGCLAGRRTAVPALLALAAAAVLVASVDATPSAAAASCPTPRATPAYERGVRRALLSKRDLWGRQLLAAPSGPTYAAVRSRLAPLLYAYGNGGRRLTRSGVYYLPFSFPFSPYGPQGFALHVADGSEIVTRRADGRSLAMYVGAGGRELYGSCLARLTPARLADGYLPILETAYVD